MTIIETAKMNGLDPQAYLTDILGRTVSTITRLTASTSCCHGTGRR
jgi:hypothetical protein